RRRGGRRPSRGARHRGLLPQYGQQLQPRAETARGRGRRRRRTRDRAAGDRGRPSRVGHGGSMSPVKVARLGCGIVGTGVVRLLHDQADDLTARVGAPLELVGIGVRRTNRDRGLLPVRPDIFTADALSLVKRDDVDIVVEVVGGIEPARTWLVEALRGGRSVVTANKALLAEDGGPVHDAAVDGNADLYYEASVAGAIPLLRPLRESLHGDR